MISVLMSTYNRAAYVRQAIDSVLTQTYKDLELIIVDDGSTDNTREIIESYEDDRIRYMPLAQNSFYCYAANYGLKSCKGDYVAFINSDDEWLPEKLEKQLHFMEENPTCGACFSEVYLMDGEGLDITDEVPGMRDVFATRFESRKEWMNYLIRIGNCLCHPSALVRKNILDEIGGFNLMYCQLADHDLWIRILEKASVYVMEERLIRFRWDIKKKNQVSSATEEHFARSFNEKMMIRRDTIERMSDEVFAECFGDTFKNPASSTQLEIAFEKAFFLATCMHEAPEWKILGIEKLEKVLRTPGAMEVLRNHFQMNIFDIYNWNKTYMYRDPWVLNELATQKAALEQQKKEAEDQIRRVKEALDKVQKEYEAVNNNLLAIRRSKAWKLIQLYRKIVGKHDPTQD